MRTERSQATAASTAVMTSRDGAGRLIRNRTIPTLSADARATGWKAGPLAAGTRYAWRVDAIGPEGRVRGETWVFTTSARPFRIALAGDSTVTERQGWGTGFASLLGAGATCANHARGGRSTKSFVEEEGEDPGHCAVVEREMP